MLKKHKLTNIVNFLKDSLLNGKVSYMETFLKNTKIVLLGNCVPN